MTARPKRIALSSAAWFGTGRVPGSATSTTLACVFGSAPYAVEALTYRTAPHGAADFFEKYRTKEEVQEWRERDPIGMVEHKLIENDVLDEDGIEEIKGEAKERIQEAVEFADESEEPPEEELYTDVYAGEDEYTGEA